MVAAETFGRDDQLATLRERLASDLPTAVLIEGEAGIGKTKLLRAAVEDCRARGFRILESAPAEAEASLAFGALADLVGALAEEIVDAVPVPRWRALAASTGLVDDGRAVPEGTSVALGLVATLRAAAAQAPELVTIDDVQWLDESSATVLAFALRRLAGDDRVALVLTRRSNTQARARLDLHGSILEERLLTMDVGPLSIGAVHRLVRVRLSRSLGRRQLLEIYEASRGNPLHALELARAFEDGVSSAGTLKVVILRIEDLKGQPGFRWKPVFTGWRTASGIALRSTVAAVQKAYGARLHTLPDSKTPPAYSYSANTYVVTRSGGRRWVTIFSFSPFGGSGGPLRVQLIEIEEYSLLAPIIKQAAQIYGPADVPLK